MSVIVGIDLGTSSCSVAAFIDGQPQVLPVFDGLDEMPTYVAFTSDGERLVGMAAKRQSVTNPENTIFAIKRLIGRKFADPATQNELGLLPYRVVPSAAGYLWIEAGGRSYTPTEITAMMLSTVRQRTDSYLGLKTTLAVMTVPAYFDESQRQATREAAALAGYDLLSLIAEPTAAALAYGFERIQKRVFSKAITIGVYDLGGGTFDFSILEIGEGVFEVRAVAGDNRLGGEDFDHALVRHFVQQIKQQYGIDLHNDALALHRIKEAAENIKIQLDVTQTANIELRYLAACEGQFVNVVLTLNRREFECLVEGLIDRTLTPCSWAIRDAGLTPNELNEFILVGGMSRMPVLPKRICDRFGIKPKKHHNPSRVVALGAAVQAHVRSGALKDILLLDAIPMSLGIETLGGVFTRVVDRNTTIPTRRSQVFAHVDLSETDKVKVFQGESDKVSDNLLLAEIPIDSRDAPPDAGLSFDVTFDIEADGLFYVWVENKLTGEERRQLIKVFDPFRRDTDVGIIGESSAQELGRMRAEAEELLNVIDGALKVHRESIHLHVLKAVDGARVGLVRAMQSRDKAELTGAIAAMAAASNIAPPDHRGAASKPPEITMKATGAGLFIFVSYARPDTRWLDHMRVHFKPLERAGKVEIWHDGKIEVGTMWEIEIEKALAKSSAAILLVSANFMASNFIYDHELPPILRRSREHDLWILPIVVGHCLYECDPDLSTLKPWNDPEFPLSAMSDDEIAKKFSKLAAELWARVKKAS